MPGVGRGDQRPGYCRHFPEAAAHQCVFSASTTVALSATHARLPLARTCALLKCLPGCCP